MHFHHTLRDDKRSKKGIEEFENCRAEIKKQLMLQSLRV